MDISSALVTNIFFASRRWGCPVFSSSDCEFLAYGIGAVGLVGGG